MKWLTDKLTVSKRSIGVILYISILLLANRTLPAQDLTPDDLVFRRYAVQRMIFDRSQNIPLAGLNPAKVVGLDVMHPEVGQHESIPNVTIEQGRLKIRAENPSTTSRWIGGFNPIAFYDLAIYDFKGSGTVGLLFQDNESENRIMADILVDDGMYRYVTFAITKNGQEVERYDFTLPTAIPGNESLRLQVQMVGIGVNLFIEHENTTTLIGRVDVVKHFDLRSKEMMQHFEFCLHSSLMASSSVEILEASAALSPGIGQADIRNVTFEDGTPFFRDERLWITMSVRGGHLGHSMQGVFSLDPSVFDIQFEGIILFDRGDGLLRNELASHIFYDRNVKEWRGFTTGFSSYGDPEKQEKKQIWAVQSAGPPLQGISIMKAKSISLIGNYEDPQCVYDEAAAKWRMLLCESHNGYKAVIRESEKWDGIYKQIAGPVDVNTTGTQLQKIGQKYYAIFGSSERKVYIYSYPDLEPVSELQMHRPPWDDKINSRVWPNVFPLPEGYPAPYMALMMDRLNFPGMTGSNWTYGAMYLYHGNIK